MACALVIASPAGATAGAQSSSAGRAAAADAGATPAAGVSLIGDTPPAARGGDKWGSRRITYSNETKYPNIVAAAVKRWNSVTKGLRLKKVKGKGQIRVRAKNCPANTTPCAYYPSGGGDVYMGKYWSKRGSFADDPAASSMQFNLLIHELGHSIGLTHRSGCSIMQPIINAWEAECRGLFGAQGSGYYACAPQKVDVAAIAQRYGTKAVKGAGRCRTPIVPTSIASPTKYFLKATAVNYRSVIAVKIKNRSKVTMYGYYRNLTISPISSTDRYGTTTSFCNYSSQVGANERVVRPGGYATFSLPVCSTSGGTVVQRFRTEYFDGFATRFGAAFSVTTVVDPEPYGYFEVGQPAPVTGGQEVAFTTDVTDNGPVTYSWNFGEPASGSRNISALKNPVHVYASPGDYDVTLVVRDTAGQTLTQTSQVYISLPWN